MKVADLYIRVSTDEQAEKGYSQRDQEDRLRRYCEINSIAIRKVIYEDHSAKTFNRPEWKKILVDLKRNRGKIDVILFIKWDRFSRNAGDAYQMIGTLRRLGVEPQAVEQPLDLSVPENKMMLAFYLAAPEVENDRRALNTFHGMRRAKKEGRWMATAPMGYVNTTVNGVKTISPAPLKSEIIAWAFQEIAKGVHSIKHVWREVNKRGYKCASASFERAIRNPVFCGLIIVPKYMDEEEHLVPGQHEPLISKELFYQVQDVLHGRTRKLTLRPDKDQLFPLRGFMVCPKCGRNITGSSSKGKYKYYHYYHCDAACGVRMQKKDVDHEMVEFIKQYELPEEMLDLITIVFQHIFNSKTAAFGNELSQVKNELSSETDRLKKARNMLLDGDLDAVDYREIKAESEQRIERLESKLEDLEARQVKFNPAVLVKLTQLSRMYQNGTSEEIRTLMSSMFMEKIVFSKLKHRTPEVNPVLQLIKLINNKLQGEKSEAKLDISALPLWVTPEIQKSNSFAHGMKLLEILAA